MQKNAYIPDAFIQHVKTYIPEHISLDAFLAYCQTPLRKSIRVNTLKITVDDFIQRMENQGWSLSAIPWCKQGFWVERPEVQESLPLGNTAEHLAGLFYIQEASSMLPAVALFDEVENTNITILDVAAAPGSKTTQISAMMDNNGFVIANEFSSSRTRYLAANFQRCGISNAAITHFDGKVFGGWAPESFDAILLDAPCSGEGTIRKDPEALKNWSMSSIENIAKTQCELLVSAFLALKPGGSLVYSTCTLNPIENHQTIVFLQQRFPDVVEIQPLGGLFSGAEQSQSSEGFLHVWPQLFDSEGFFIAKIRKLKSVDFSYTGKARKNFPFVKPSKANLNDLSVYLEQQFGFKPELLSLYQRDDQYWLFPSGSQPFLDKLRFERIGVKLAEQHRKGFRLAHDAFITHGQHFTRNRLELNQQQLTEFYQGRDLPWPLKDNIGEAGVYYDGFPIGLVKGLKGKLKNALPRELVRDNRLISWE